MKIPTAERAETALLGAILADGAGFAVVGDRVRASDFYNVANGLVWGAMVSLAEAGTPIDLLTVCDRMESLGTMGTAGGVAYVASLAEGLPDKANPGYYAEMIVNASVKRQLLTLSMQMTQDCGGDALTGNEIMATVHDGIMGISARASGHEVRSLAEILSGVTATLQTVAHHGIQGVQWGYPDIDSMTLAMEPEDLWILAARPSCGKTALAGCVAANACAKGKSVYFATLEMSAESIVRRILAREGRIWYRKLRQPMTIDRPFWESVAAAQDRIADWRLFIDDVSGISVGSLMSRAQRVQMQHGLDLVVVDYLQLMGGEGVNANERIGGITKGLKGVAKALKVPILLLSQLSRDSAKTHREPNLTDLRDSGSIEQDADVVVFLHPESVTESGDSAVMKVIVGKQRNGETGDRKLVFVGGQLRFESYAREER